MNISQFSFLQNYECTVIDCSEDWRKKRKKINSENNECVNDCYLTNYKFEYEGKCYETCPKETKIVKSYGYLCEKICPQEFPFLIVEDQKCVSNCNINDLINKRCVIHIEKNISNEYNESNVMLYNLLNEIKNNFEPEIMKEKGYILIEENEVIFEITTIDNFAKNNNINNEIGECEKIIRMDYNNLFNCKKIL